MSEPFAKRSRGGSEERDGQRSASADDSDDDNGGGLEIVENQGSKRDKGSADDEAGENRRDPYTCRHEIKRQHGKFHLLSGVSGSVAVIKLAELIEELHKFCPNNRLWIKKGMSGPGGPSGAGKLDLDHVPNLSDKPIYDVDLAQMEDRPWRKPGADLTDYFNYGFTEETWNMYCERQKKLRLEFTTQAAANKALFNNIALPNPLAMPANCGRQLINLAGGDNTGNVKVLTDNGGRYKPHQFHNKMDNVEKGMSGPGGPSGAGKLDLDHVPNLSDKPIYDVDLAQMEDRPWRKPGADLTDYFNYGFTEETWNMYCERQKKLRLEFTTQAAANKALFNNIALPNPLAMPANCGRQLINLAGGDNTGNVKVLTDNGGRYKPHQFHNKMDNVEKGMSGPGGPSGAGKLDLDHVPNLSDKPIYDVDLAQMEDRPWRKPGADLTDYFNYGFTEETWNMYCERQKKLRLEFTTQAAANKALFNNIALPNPLAMPANCGRQLINLAGGDNTGIVKVLTDNGGRYKPHQFHNKMDNVEPIVRTVIGGQSNSSTSIPGVPGLVQKKGENALRKLPSTASTFNSVGVTSASLLQIFIVFCLLNPTSANVYSQRIVSCDVNCLAIFHDHVSRWESGAEATVKITEIVERGLKWSQEIAKHINVPPRYLTLEEITKIKQIQTSLQAISKQLHKELDLIDKITVTVVEGGFDNSTHSMYKKSLV